MGDIYTAYKITGVVGRDSYGNTFNSVEMNGAEIHRLWKMRLITKKLGRPPMGRIVPLPHGGDIMLPSDEAIYYQAVEQGFVYQAYTGCEGFKQTCSNNPAQYNLFCPSCKSSFKRHFNDAIGSCSDCPMAPCLFYKRICYAMT